MDSSKNGPDKTPKFHYLDFAVPHNYLRKDLSGVLDFNPRLLTRIMDKKMAVNTTCRNLEPPFLKLSSSHPIVYAPSVDGTRGPVAFGRWALPKLKKELHHHDVLVKMQALNSIHDMVHNPEKAYEAIHTGVVDRLADMMLKESDFVREKVCMILVTIAGIEEGRRTITRRYKILHNLAMLTEDKVDAVRHKAQLVLERIVSSPVGAAALSCADFMLLLLRLVGGLPKTENEDIVLLHMVILKSFLIRRAKALALEHNALNIMMEKLNHPKEGVVCRALECIALLCEHPRAREEGAKKNLGYVLCKKLFDPSLEVRIKTAGALAFATIHSEIRRKLSKKCAVDILVGLLEYMHNGEGQVSAAKVLTNLSEAPLGKSIVRKMKARIEKAIPNNFLVDRHKGILINVLTTKKSGWFSTDEKTV